MKTPTLVIRNDYSHLAEIRDALKAMRKACRAKNIENPVDILVPSDGLLDNMPPLMLEQAIVLCAWPATDVRTGGPEGKVQVGQGAKGQVLIFHDRKHVIQCAVDVIRKATAAMEGKDAPETRTL